MNFNDILCKQFDYNHKGYVTVGNICSVVFCTAVALLIYSGASYMVWCALKCTYEYYILKSSTSLMTEFEIMFVGPGLLILGLTIVVIILVVVILISNIKIATCKLKNK